MALPFFRIVLVTGREIQRPPKVAKAKRNSRGCEAEVTVPQVAGTLVDMEGKVHKDKATEKNEVKVMGGGDHLVEARSLPSGRS